MLFLGFSNSRFSSVTSMLMLVASLPISIISRDLPFYASEGTTAAITYWVLNLLVQTSLLYALVLAFRNRKN